MTEDWKHEEMEGPIPSSRRRAARLLSWIVLSLAVLQSSGGLLVPGLYRDNALVVAGWPGNDLVTLLVAVPTLGLSLGLANRGSPRARLVWLGALSYMLYNGAFYLFAAAFNEFCLVYAAVFSLSILALILAAAGTDVEAVARRVDPTAGFKWISGFMLLVAAGLTLAYLSQIVGFIVDGQLPAIVRQTGHPTSVIFALDLSLVVPFFALGAIWLWQRRPWGYVVAAIMNVKGAIYMTALSAVTLSTFIVGAIEGVSELAVWGPIGVGCLLASRALLARLDPSPG